MLGDSQFCICVAGFDIVAHDLRDDGDAGALQCRCASVGSGTGRFGGALELAEQHGLTLPGADTVRALFEESDAAGYGDNYWPALINVIDAKKE